MAEKWYNLSAPQIEGRLKTDIKNGLSPKAAAKRIQKDGRNTVYVTPKATFGRLAADVVKDPCAYMLIAAAVLAGIFEQNVSASVIVALVLVNWIGVLCAYFKARSVLEGTTARAIPTATVIRGGKRYLVKQDRLCRGDIILLGKGDVVPADARVIESDSLCVLEVSLTGDIRAKKKDPKVIYANNLPPDMQSGMVFATTVVSQGSGRAVVCETGADTLARILDRNVHIVEHDKLGALASLKKYCSVWSLVMLSLIFALSVLDFAIGFQSRGLFNIFITGLSLATAAMCEFYVVFGYIIIGCGLYGISKKGGNERTGALIKRSQSLETLARITTLVVPGEGAFMTSAVILDRLWCDSTVFSADEKRLANTCGELISCAFASTSFAKNGYEKLNNRFKSRGVAPEERAILSLAARTGVLDAEYIGSHSVAEYSENAGKDTLVKALVMENGKGRLVIRGVLSDVLPLCRQFRTNEKVKDIKYEKTKILHCEKQISDEGYAVIGVASKPIDSKTIKDSDCTGGFVFEGFISVSKPQLAGAAENVRALCNAGIKVIMLSNEASASTRNYAKALGLIEGENEIMTSNELKKMPDDLFRTNASLYGLYEGLDVSQKRLLITHLQQNGEVVGFFGNDFDDIILLKESNIGYSSGITLNRKTSFIDLGNEENPVFINNGEETGAGSEALKLVCDVIVSPATRRGGGFNAIAASIMQSAAVFANLRRMLRYLITSQSARLFAVLYSVLAFGGREVFSGEDIFTPVQLLTLGLIIDFIVIIVIAFSPAGVCLQNRKDTDSGFESPFTSNLKYMLFGLFWAVCALAVPVIMRLIGVNITDKAMSAMVFYSFILSQIVTALHTIREKSVFEKGFRRNRTLIISLGAAAVFIAQTALIPALNTVFNTCMLSLAQWPGVVVPPVLLFAVYELYRVIHRDAAKQSEDTENSDIPENDQNEADSEDDEKKEREDDNDKEN